MIDIRSLGSSSAGNCYQITDGVTPLLIECGMPIRRIQAGTGYSLSGVAGCLISHEHGDHSRAARDLMRLGVTCYMSQGTASALKLEPQHRLQILVDRQPVRVGSWVLLPFQTIHDAAEPLGFVLDTRFGERLLFLTDTGYSPFRFAGLTHMLVECNFSDEALEDAIDEGRTHGAQRQRLRENHMSENTLVQLLQANDLRNLREIHLIHLSDSNSDEAAMKLRIQGIAGCPVYVCAK
ncbi:MAG: MBL fold metallo-hydrolase [Candidatus Cloacimonetes bacterium]|nr:MBL fold metallo-hydrolase [Candidatus Cloacimonadota bacterium]